MKVATADRRVTRRYTFEAPFRVRIWKSDIPEHRAESENLSEKGIFFATDSLPRVGTTVEILLEMPEEINDEPTIEWRHRTRRARRATQFFTRQSWRWRAIRLLSDSTTSDGLAIPGEANGDSTSRADHRRLAE